MATNNAANNVTAAVGKVLMGAGIGVASTYSAATYPSSAGTSGNLLSSDGTNWVSTPPLVKTISGNTGGALIPTAGNWSIQSNSINGLTPSFIGSGSTLSLVLVDGSDNIFIGRVSGKAGHTANNNVALGTGALQNVTSAQSNAIVGFAAGNAITSGQYNVAVGRNALSQVSTSNGSTAIGQEALGGATGPGNSALGYRCLASVTTGQTNACLGYTCGSNYVGAESNNILLQHPGVAAESNVMRLGFQGSGIGQVNQCFIAGINGVTITAGATTLCDANGKLGTVVSSIRYKENVNDINDNLSILDLRPVEFNYKSDDSKTKAFGFIAEEVEKIIPELCIYGLDGEIESVKYHEMSALLLKEIQRLNERILRLEEKMTK